MNIPKPIETRYLPLPRNKEGALFGHDTLCKKLDAQFVGYQVLGYGWNCERGDFVMLKRK